MLNEIAISFLLERIYQNSYMKKSLKRTGDFYLGVPKVYPERLLENLNFTRSQAGLGSPGRARTADLMINSHPLYRLSYRGMRGHLKSILCMDQVQAVIFIFSKLSLLFFFLFKAFESFFTKTVQAVHGVTQGIYIGCKRKTNASFVAECRAWHYS
jgi:hypothetical protein